MAATSALRELRELLDLKFPDAAPLERHRTEGNGPRRLVLDLEVGLGDVEVRSG